MLHHTTIRNLQEERRYLKIFKKLIIFLEFISNIIFFLKNQNSNGQYQNLRTHPSPGMTSIYLNFNFLYIYIYILFFFNFLARKFRRGRRQIHEWAGGDVNDFKSEEFDFQGNLNLFDKEKVFAEIRVSKLFIRFNTIN
jgi:hypothetical protein